MLPIPIIKDKNNDITATSKIAASCDKSGSKKRAAQKPQMLPISGTIKGFLSYCCAEYLFDLILLKTISKETLVLKTSKVSRIMHNCNDGLLFSTKSLYERILKRTE